MIIYLDTSALARVYLGDQIDGTELSRIVYDGPDPVITSELTDVEIASALSRAVRDGTIDDSTRHRLLDRYVRETADDGPLGIVGVDHDTVRLAQQYVGQVAVRSLDALHLASCSRFAVSDHEDVRLLSRDQRQNAAATELGIALVGD